MKLTFLCLLLSFFQLMANDGFSQSTRITLNLKNTRIEDVLMKLEEQSGFYFIYNREVVNVNQKVDVSYTDQKISDVLIDLFKGTNVEFEMQDRHVILKNSTVSAQQLKSVSGKVTDSSGAPLPGVTVIVKGTTQGIITDMDGKYTISNISANTILVFSFVGMKTEEVSVSGRSTINIVLEEETIGIEEVVAVGYGTMRKVDMTGSAGSVSANEIIKAPVKSFDEAMAGRIAGVQVSSGDGQPGSAPNIVIRGSNSLTQDNSPLYVIDGFPIEGNNNDAINPNDIESIDVLKDASATAIYGARGANGVIMITTKRGKSGATVVSYNGYYGFQENIKTIETLNPYDFVKLQMERDLPAATYQYITKPNRILDDYKTIEGIDWFGKCLQSAPMQNHDIAIRGGNANNRYSVSSSYFGQEGIFINTGYRRWQGRVTLDQVINSKSSFGININYSDTKRYGLVAADGGNSTGVIYSSWSYRPVFPEPDIDLDYDVLDPALNPALDYRTNPVLQLKNEHRESTSYNMIANGYFEYKIDKNLKLRITGGVNRGTSRSDIFNNSKTSTGNPASPNYKGINGSETYSNFITFSNDNTLTWTKSFNKDHNLNVVGGFTQQMGRTDRFGATAVLITNESLGMDALDEGTPNRIDSGSSLWTIQSFLGRVNYNYKSKYLFTASFRADGSSKLSLKNRWGYFPSAALAYRLSQEEFIKKVSFIDDAKIRVSYGATGNNRVSDFAYLSSISALANEYTFGSAVPSPGSRATTLGNANLKWETTLQFNTGIDVALLNNRLSFTGDYYYKKTKDLLLSADMPYLSGYSWSYKNIGSVSNRGVELSVNYNIIKRSNFSWNSSFNISFNRNKVLALADDQEAITSVVSSTANGFSVTPAYIAKIGQPIAMFYGVIDDGLYSYDDFNQLTDGTYILKENVPTNGATRASIKPGHAKRKDLNGDLVVDKLDYTIIGDPNPDFIGGLNNRFEYRGFDLNVFFQFSYGNDVYNANRLQFEGGAYTVLNTNYYATYTNRWTEENPNGIYPRIGGMGSYHYSSRYVEDASFLRLKTVSLGYTIPSKILKVINIKTARIYCTSQNLLTLTGYTGLDPEVSTRHSNLTPGFDYSPYPRATSIVFGVNLTF